MSRIVPFPMRSTWFCIVLVLSGVCSTVCAFAADRPNVLLLCVDDLRPELNCFGKDYIHSPNIDQLAASGRPFHRHYVQAPTCGASRFTLLTGTYGPGDNGALFKRAAQMAKTPDMVPPSMPKWFRNHGYTTVSVGKVSHHPGGRGGPDWDDDQQPEMPGAWDRHLLPAGPWQHPRGAMHGLANGEIRGNASKMDLFQSVAGDDSIYPDGLIVDEALNQLDDLGTKAKTDPAGNPFFLAVGIIRPHLPFGSPKKYMQHYVDASLPEIPHPSKPSGKTTWHGSGEFMKYNRWSRNPNDDAEFATEVRKHYAACVSYADASVGRVLSRLDSLGLRDDTIVVLWGDHGWHLGEHAVWGKHTLFEESLRSPLVIRVPGMQQAGMKTDSIVETLDVFPTLCELTRLPIPEFVDGVSLVPILNSPDAAGHDAVSYNAHRTLRTDSHRLVLHRSGEAELYDHTVDPGETKNIASSEPDLVKELSGRLTKRLAGR
ncbi:sulfatase [Stieleria varia]|uniref:Arylsulfatase n=1 Tax=Stieleria varia TaxID=2528005 RepID=A0A5C6B132_9BACT|nr:sulfatase [Stieleria varia]TWU05863.1 Arylsulfatase [Stieleria varia]